MDQLTGLLDLVLDSYTLLIAGAIFGLLRTLQSTVLGTKALYRRLLPLLPDALGVVASLLGAIPAVADKPIIIKIAMGVWCGYVAQRFQKILGQTILGDDTKIEARASEDSKDVETN